MKLNDPEQHDRGDSWEVRESKHNDTDGAVVEGCAAIKVDTPITNQGNKPLENRQIIVNFARRNVCECVFCAKSDVNSVNQQNEDRPEIYTNEDLTEQDWHERHTPTKYLAS